MPVNYIQFGTFFIEALALAGLLWYCIETSRMRTAAEKQVQESQDLIKAAMDQVEGLSKPCLTIAAGLRDPANATSSAKAVTSTVALEDEGKFVVQNIGSGPALNVSYRFVAINETAEHFRDRGAIYVQNVLVGQRIRMVEPMSAYTGDFDVIFRYESIGGRVYESKIRMTNFALTDFEFGERAAESRQV